MLIIGVDPGINGAIAKYDGTDLTVADFPKTKSKGRGFELNMAETYDLIDLLFPKCDHAYIELVGARPQEGRSTVFKFGYATGAAHGLLMGMLRCPVTKVTPTVWKRFVGATADKDYSRTRACELFPCSAAEFSRKKDNNRAEAALIAYYGYMQRIKE